MPRLLLVHWNESESEELAAQLRTYGWDVTRLYVASSGIMRDLRASPPDAFLIHLGRLPSHGREVAMGIRGSRLLREIPIIFVDGDPAKVALIEQRLPDATYTTWSKIKSAVTKVLKTPRKPVIATKGLLDYSTTPLHKKLGIKENSRVLLIDAPRTFFQAVDPVPPGVEWIEDVHAPRNLAILFAETRSDIHAHLDPLTTGSPLWIAYPKGNVSDLTQFYVREICLTAGLVDYKVCSIDSKWTGLLFKVRS